MEMTALLLILMLPNIFKTVPFIASCWRARMPVGPMRGFVPMRCGVVVIMRVWVCLAWWRIVDPWDLLQTYCPCFADLCAKPWFCQVGQVHIYIRYPWPFIVGEVGSDLLVDLFLVALLGLEWLRMRFASIMSQIESGMRPFSTGSFMMSWSGCLSSRQLINNLWKDVLGIRQLPHWFVHSCRGTVGLTLCRNHDVRFLGKMMSSSSRFEQWSACLCIQPGLDNRRFVKGMYWK